MNIKLEYPTVTTVHLVVLILRRGLSVSLHVRTAALDVLHLQQVLWRARHARWVGLLHDHHIQMLAQPYVIFVEVVGGLLVAHHCVSFVLLGVLLLQQQLDLLMIAWRAQLVQKLHLAQHHAMFVPVAGLTTTDNPVLRAYNVVLAPIQT